MVKKLPESQDNILGYKATGRLHDEDYKKIFIPDIEQAVEKYGKMRCLLYMPKEFKGWTPKAFWDDFKIGVGKFKNDYEKLAIVGGPR